MNQHNPGMPRVERLHGGVPILSRDANHPWENRVTFNPACALVDDRISLDRIISALPFDSVTKKRLQAFPALCFLLYRAQGDPTQGADWTHSTMGLAVLSPTLDLLARHDSPVLLPDKPYDNLGVEDGRLTKVGKEWLLVYTGYSTSSSGNAIRIITASSPDFIHWEKHGPLAGTFNQIDNKNAMLFPEPVGGKQLLLHRPMQGADAMCIHWAESETIEGPWRTRGPLMRAKENPEFIDTWIGGGAPPLLLNDGRYLLLYHIGNRKKDGTREYDLGIAIGDPANPRFVVKRDEPLLRPATEAETNGDASLGVNNVVFICGAYFYNGDLYFPYAGADSVILGGKISGAEINTYINERR